MCLWPIIQVRSRQFSRSVVSDSLQPHGLQHARLPCPSPTPGACTNSCPSSHDAIQPSHHYTGIFTQIHTFYFIGDIRNLKKKCHYLYKLSLISTSVSILSKNIYQNWKDFRPLTHFCLKVSLVKLGSRSLVFHPVSWAWSSSWSKVSLLYSWWLLCSHHQGCLVCEMPLDII